jgi:hypothetical protein
MVLVARRPFSPLSQLRSELPPVSGAAQRDLHERARQFLADLADDREIGCPGYRFHAEPVVSAPVIGLHGVRLDFSLTAPSGQTVERTVAYWARQDSRLFILAAEALDPGSCLERLGDQFTVARRLSPASAAEAFPFDAWVRRVPHSI